jgi:hypothetical protein
MARKRTMLPWRSDTPEWRAAVDVAKGLPISPVKAKELMERFSGDEAKVKAHVREAMALNKGPCPVRARGLNCESALVSDGVEEPEEHPLAFNGQVT